MTWWLRWVPCMYRLSFPAVVSLVWMTGLTWLILQVMRSRQSRWRGQLPLALTFAGLTVGATFNAFHTWELLYYYSASVRYTLPVGVLMIYLAFTWEIAGRLHSKAQIALAALAGAALYFVNGGLSEMHAVSQIVVLSLVLVGVRIFIAGLLRKRMLLLVSVGWLGSVASLLVQLSSPGLAARVEGTLVVGRAVPVHSARALVEATLASAIEHLAHQESLLGFVLMMSAGVALTLVFWGPTRAEAEPQPVMAASKADALLRRFGLAAVLSLVCLAIVSAVAVAIGLRSVGIVYDRVLAPIVLLQVLSGLIWGIYIGLQIRFGRLATGARPEWVTGITIVALVVAAGIYTGIVVNQIRLIPDFASYAREWDARHQANNSTARWTAAAKSKWHRIALT